MASSQGELACAASALPLPPLPPLPRARPSPSAAHHPAGPGWRARRRGKELYSTPAGADDTHTTDAFLEELVVNATVARRCYRQVQAGGAPRMMLTLWPKVIAGGGEVVAC